MADMYEKIVVDNPETNMQALWNYCRYKNGHVVFAETCDGKDVDLYEYCYGECRKKCPHIADDISLLDFMEHVMLCDMTEESCPIARLYIAAVQAAELRGRLAEYEEVETEQ